MSVQVRRSVASISSHRSAIGGKGAPREFGRTVRAKLVLRKRRDVPLVQPLLRAGTVLVDIEHGMSGGGGWSRFHGNVERWKSTTLKV